MMAVGRSTKKLQIGQESQGARGTIVAATTVWGGPVETFKDTRKVTRVPEDIGIIAPTNRTYVSFYGGELEMPSQIASFEQLPYIGEASIKDVGTGAADGAGTSKIYDYPAPYGSTKNTIQPMTLEAGDATQAEVGEFGHIEEWTLEQSHEDPLKVSAKWKVRQVAVQAFTAAQSRPTLETITASPKLYIDATGGTIGTTQKTNTFVSMKAACKSGWKPLPGGGDGNLYYPEIDYADPSLMLDLTFIHDSNLTAEKVRWRAGTAALIRLQWQGTAVGTPGTTYTYKTVRLDLAGKWMDFEVTKDKNGFQTCTGKFEAMYDSTASLFFRLLVVNELTTLP